MTTIGVLARRFGVERNEKFLSFLSESSRARVMQYSEAGSVVGDSGFFDPRDCLKGLHPSWLLKKIETMSEASQALFKKYISKLHQKRAETTPFELFILGQLFTRADLPKSLRGEAEKSEIASLIEYSVEETTQLIQLLGCHFLLDEVRKIISKKQLAAFFSSLAPLQISYLRKLLYLPKKSSFSVDLKPVIGERAALAKRVQELGFALFCAVIQQQSDAFKEHFYRGHDALFVERVKNHVPFIDFAGVGAQVGAQTVVAQLAIVTAIKGCIDHLASEKVNVDHD